MVTALCCGLTSSSPWVDPEDAQARLKPYQELVLAEIERFGGTRRRRRSRPRPPRQPRARAL